MHPAKNAMPEVSTISLQSSATGTAEKTFDPSAALARAESLVRCLREGRVADAFHLDDTAAERMLRYFKKEARKPGSATEADFDHVLDFCRMHDQSLDWLFCGEPGVMICRAAKGSPRAEEIARRRKREVLKGRGPSMFDLYRLPFFDVNAPFAKRSWSVAPTGNYSADCDTGAAYAIAFLRSCDGTYGWRSLLAAIVASMIEDDGIAPRRSNGIVVGFMSTIGMALAWKNVTTEVADALERMRIEDKKEIDAVYAELRQAKPRRRGTKRAA